MARANVSVYRGDGRPRRRGIHAKTKNSWNPNSKNYKKKYRGQGR